MSINFFIIFAYAVVILTTIVTTLSIAIVLFNSFAIRREKLIQIERQRLNKCISLYLKGEIDNATLIRETQGQESLILGVVVQMAEKADEIERQKLISMFERCGLKSLYQNELSNLSSKKVELRVHAVTYLPFIVTEGLLYEGLMTALEDETLDVRLAAAKSLARLKFINSVGPILNHLALPATWPIHRISEILNEMGAGVIDPLIAYLNKPQISDASIMVAMSVLGTQKAQTATNAIVQYINHPDKEVRVQAIKALGRIGNIDNTPDLAQGLRDDSWEVRSASATALGLLKNPSTVSELGKSLCDPEWWVRYNSGLALVNMGEEGVAILQNALGLSDKFASEISRQILEEHHIVPTEHLESK